MSPARLARLSAPSSRLTKTQSQKSSRRIGRSPKSARSKPGRSSEKRGPAQVPLPLEGPGVVGADDGRFHVAVGLGEELVRAVAAHVVEGPEDLVAPLHDEDVLVADSERHVVSRIREGGPVRDVLPRAVEDRLLLPLVDRRVGVVLRREGERGSRLVGDWQLHRRHFRHGAGFIEHRSLPPGPRTGALAAVRRVRQHGPIVLADQPVSGAGGASRSARGAGSARAAIRSGP